MTFHTSYRVFIAILISLITSACASHQTNHYKNHSSSNSSGRATQKPYTVAGKRYEPLVSHEGFIQEGVASSYGTDFHGKKTSNGERFDMYAMTAAHKTLPLGVYVKVKHKRNGKEIIVRVNDRGPFVRDRIIDLSEAAAEKLGMLHEGIAQVTIIALGYKAEQNNNGATYRSPSSYDSGQFALQVAAVKNRVNAYKYADELRARHGSADVQEATISGVTYYRIRMGSFRSLKEAQSAQDSYEHKGFPGCFVVALN